mgnify:CR=1 FL=1
MRGEIYYEKFKGNTQFVDMTEGKYTFIPYTSNFSYHPKSLLMELKENGQEGIEFDPVNNPGLYQVWGAVDLVREGGYHEGISGLKIGIFKITDLKNPVRNAYTNDQGIFVLDSVPPGHYFTFPKDIDTNIYDFHEGIISLPMAGNPGGYRSIKLRSKTDPFTHKYEFESYQDDYEEIDGEVVISGAEIFNKSIRVNIPFPFRYGYNTFDSLFINPYGFIHFGAYPMKSISKPLSENNITRGIISPMAYSFSFNNNATAESDSLSKISVDELSDGDDRIFLIQWENMLYTNSATGEVNARFDFQIKLHEMSNIIEFVYGDFRNEGLESQFCTNVGLRGINNEDFNIRNTEESWENSTAGSENIECALISADNYPEKGLIYRWTPSITGVKEQLAITDNFFDINPNIVSDKIKIEFNDPVAGEAEITIIDQIGKIVRKITCNQQSGIAESIEIDVRDLPQGMYFCRISNNGKIFSRKVILIR